MQPTPRQLKKLEKLAELVDKGNVAVLEYLYEIDEKLENEIPQIKDVISRVKGDKGDTYVLTDDDKAKIAELAESLVDKDTLIKEVFDSIKIPYADIAKEASKYIQVPVVEKVIEKTETIKEIPIVTNEIKEVAVFEPKLITENPTFVRDALELLQGEDRMKREFILGLEDYDDVKEEIQKVKKAIPAGGSIARNLYQLADVQLSGVTDNQVLTYDSTTRTWRNENASSGGLSSLTSPNGSIDIGGTLTDPTVDVNLTYLNGFYGQIAGINTWTGDNEFQGQTTFSANANFNSGITVNAIGTYSARQNNSDLFVNNATTDWTASDVVIAAGGSDIGGAWIGFKWNFTNNRVYLQNETGALYNLEVDTLYANNSIVSNQITGNQLITSTITAAGSGGILLEANSGTDVLLLGAGGGSNATFYGGVNIAGNLAVDTDTLFADSTNNRVGLGITTPQNRLHIDSGTATASNIQFTAGTTTGQTSTDGFHIGITSAGIGEIRQRENSDIGLYVNNTLATYWDNDGQISFGALPSSTLLGRYQFHGTGTTVGTAPIIGIWHTTDSSATKNAGIVTQTRMTSRYLRTWQNIGQNDNSFANAGVVQWTAWEYSDNAYTTLATPTEFTGWSYQYWNGSAYVNLLRVHTSGIYIGAANASTAPTAKLHIKADSSTSSTNAFRIWNAGSVDRLLFRDDGRLWVGTGSAAFNETFNIVTSSGESGLALQTTATGTGSGDGFRLQYQDGTGIRYINGETTPHIFYVNGSEVVRMQTGTSTDPVMLITGTLAARYTGAGSSRGGAISLVSSIGTPQDWLMAVAGNDNSIVNGRSWFLYDNTNAVARFFVDTSSRVGVGLGNSAATSFVDIAAGTTAIGQLRLRAGVAPTSPNDGEIWYENTNDRLMFRKNTTSSEVVLASAVTTEVVTSDTTLTITYNGVTYKLLAKA